MSENREIARERLLERISLFVSAHFNALFRPCSVSQVGRKFGIQAARVGWRAPELIQALVKAGRVQLMFNPLKEGTRFLFPKKEWDEFDDFVRHEQRWRVSSGFYDKKDCYAKPKPARRVVCRVSKERMRELELDLDAVKNGYKSIDSP